MRLQLSFFTPNTNKLHNNQGTEHRANETRYRLLEFWVFYIIYCRL